MNRFAHLLDRLSYQPARNGKLRLIADYLRHTPDPERGYALAALTGELSFRHAKPALVRDLAAERVDPALFALSYDFVGDLSETVALLWTPRDDAPGSNHPPLLLSEVVEGLARAGRNDLRRLLAGWLDALDETGRWALLKLITVAGGLTGSRGAVNFDRGMADQLNTTLQSILDSSSGVLTAATDSLNKTVQSYQSRQTELQAQLAVIQQRYLQQFNAMDALVASMQQTSSFLTQQLTAMQAFSINSKK